MLCARIITLPYIFFEWLPFVLFHTILSGAYLMRFAVQKSDNSTIHNIWVIALFFILNFSPELCITQKVFEMSTWNFKLGFNLLRRNAVRKNDNSTLYNFWVIALCYFSYLLSGHFLKSDRGINLKLGG
jgi:hypothetical protein